MKPEISVVIPLYNKERYIRRAIESVLRQTFRNFECIIIDSSTDGSQELVRQYNDLRIVLVSCEKSTAAQARNQGVRIAQSDLIAFLDADDEWQPDHLETLIHIRKKFPDAGLYSTPYVKIKPDGHPMVMLFPGIPHPPWEGYVPNYLWTCSRGDEPVHSSSCAIPRDIFLSSGGFPDGFEYGEDQYLWGKIALFYPVAYSWNGLTMYHTEAVGRICDKPHIVTEQPFITYLRRELARGTIPPVLQADCKDYIRRKKYSEFFSRLYMGGSVPCNGESAEDEREIPGSSRINRCFTAFVKTTGRVFNWL
jgi:glycosyltransferase involved in cell wall biosynthesis